MPLGPALLLELVHSQGLVSDLSERELTEPEGAGFDLRIGEIMAFKKGSKAFLGITERQTPDVEVLASFDPKSEKQTIFKLEPGKLYAMSTVESVKLPEDIAAENFTRTTLPRCGVLLMCTQVAPGYEGKLTYWMINLWDEPVEIEMGARVAHIRFERVEGKGSKYRGQWQGGRVAATKKEVQV